MAELKKTLSILLSIFALAIVSAQKKIDTQHLLWGRYYLKFKLDHYTIGYEAEERTYWFPWRQHQFLTRIHLQRNLIKNWEAGIGFAYLLQSLPHNPHITNFYNRSELRPQLEVSCKQSLFQKLNIHHRYWWEFRFYEQPNGSFRFGNNRIRYKLELKYLLLPKITLKIFDEVLFNIGKKITYNTFDQNRIGGSIQFMPDDTFGLELGYFNWFQQQKTGSDFYNRNIIRFTIHHELNFKKLNN
ncbi:DUF2490 domain-containing protein [Abyssalbus ytuae]|uniref:DUF2490 domain-containing protein n=1 Tax=Abyssalbus ytuae TaxID=2926907 RepID=A0A9E7D2M4_9FLAO|nr:DUF2490 domain-containing protein [Abyssalbus ytuae]UOB16839.1 DUF2490 domain-containing protein [Abyssalbus ytuae]